MTPSNEGGIVESGGQNLCRSTFVATLQWHPSFRKNISNWAGQRGLQYYNTTPLLLSLGTEIFYRFR